MVIKPILCFVRSYFLPGLPKPTISFILLIPHFELTLYHLKNTKFSLFSQSACLFTQIICIMGQEHIIFEGRSEEHTSELQSRFDLVCRLLLEKTNCTLKTVRLKTTTIKF